MLQPGRAPEERVREVPRPAVWALTAGGREGVSGQDRLPAGVAVAAAGEGAAVIDAAARAHLVLCLA